MRLFKIPVLVLLAFICISCSNGEISEQSEKKTTSVKPVEQVVCRSSPPILNSEGIKRNLIKRGVITSDMSAAEAEKKVSEFINKKRSAFKNCGKNKKK
ncbi:MAG: hypothetical protein HAW66_08600 [Shewanella sp.]|nr:hypothetical protein [Shewanella sp.]